MEHVWQEFQHFKIYSISSFSASLVAQGQPGWLHQKHSSALATAAGEETNVVSAGDTGGEHRHHRIEIMFSQQIWRNLCAAIKQRRNPKEETGSDISSFMKEGVGQRKEEADAEQHLSFVRLLFWSPDDHQAYFYSHTLHFTTTVRWLFLANWTLTLNKISTKNIYVFVLTGKKCLRHQSYHHTKQHTPSMLQFLSNTEVKLVHVGESTFNSRWKSRPEQPVQNLQRYNTPTTSTQTEQRSLILVVLKLFPVHFERYLKWPAKHWVCWLADWIQPGLEKTENNATRLMQV